MVAGFQGVICKKIGTLEISSDVLNFAFNPRRQAGVIV
jgi:hypothetical protein